MTTKNIGFGIPIFFLLFWLALLQLTILYRGNDQFIFAELISAAFLRILLMLAITVLVAILSLTLVASADSRAEAREWLVSHPNTSNKTFVVLSGLALFATFVHKP